MRHIVLPTDMHDVDVILIGARLNIILPPSPPGERSGRDGDGRGDQEDDGDEEPEDEAADHVAGRRRVALLAGRRRLRSLCKWSRARKNSVSQD